MQKGMLDEWLFWMDGKFANILYGYSLNAPTEVVKQIIVNIESGVEVEVTIAA